MIECEYLFLNLLTVFFNFIVGLSLEFRELFLYFFILNSQLIITSLICLGNFRTKKWSGMSMFLALSLTHYSSDCTQTLSVWNLNFIIFILHPLIVLLYFLRSRWQHPHISICNCPPTPNTQLLNFHRIPFNIRFQFWQSSMHISEEGYTRGTVFFDLATLPFRFHLDQELKYWLIWQQIKLNAFWKLA